MHALFFFCLVFYSPGKHLQQKNLYVHAEWTKTRILYEGNFEFSFQIGDMPPRVFPICLYSATKRVDFASFDIFAYKIHTLAQK